MKIGFWKILSLVGAISEELTEAFADDQKIDAVEMLKLGGVVAKKLSLPIDSNTQKIITCIIEVTDEVLRVSEDNVITAAEITLIITKMCKSLGIDISGGIKV